MKKKNSLKRFLVVSLSIIFGIVVYAYGFTVTKVNLDETKSETRQTQLVRIIRALAKPDIFEYDQTEVTVEVPITIPCPDAGITAPTPDKSGPYMTLDSYCAADQSTIHVYGYNFEPGLSGSLSFVPPSGVKLTLGDFTPDNSGKFDVEVKLPKGRTSDQVQTIRAVTRTKVGDPKLTETAKDTWDKIVETVFLALLATTIGTLIAIPLSFFAARNLMENVKGPILGVSLGIIAMPIGFLVGIKGANYANLLAQLLLKLPIVAGLVFILVPIAIYFLLKWSLPQVELTKPTLQTRILRVIALTFCAFSAILILYLISYIGINVGNWLEANLGVFAFMGKFVADLGDILNILIVIIAAFGGLGVFNSLAGGLGRNIVKRVSKPVSITFGFIFGGLAGIVVALILGSLVKWLYLIDDPWAVYYYPAIAGAVLGLVISFITRKSGILPIGMVIYYVTRTIFNALRSIEALIMAIIFVVWVGIGPFAGALALSLHTIAALIKLYSEQVESIMDGPIEAVKATGANQLQTIIYAVVPQIIPPYISFTMYRWDINVRMSTIIGFAGGGGIGFLLQQNINLLNYRAASVQMIAIAIVVASMDYLSSRLRERVI